MDAIRIVPGGNYEGTGRSRGLARGLLVYFGDLNLTGEGMGIGGVAVRDRTCTYLSRSWNDRADGERVGRTYTLDTRSGWSVMGRPSPWVTRGIESAVGAYMRLPSLQNLLLRPVPRVRSALKIEPLFETVPPVGEVSVTCAVQGGHVDVRVKVHPPILPGSTVCLLNELSAEWFTAAVRNEAIAPPPPGWEALGLHDPPVYLYDPEHGVRFTLTGPSVFSPVPSRLFWGRERTGDLCWAGFCLELGPLEDLQEPLEARYDIHFSGDGCP